MYKFFHKQTLCLHLLGPPSRFLLCKNFKKGVNPCVKIVYKTLLYLILPANKETIISSIKLNISMSLIGVIMGEFLVSKAGIGYLILYGTQVFNLNLVMSGIILIMIMSFIIYEIISIIEKRA